MLALSWCVFLASKISLQPENELNAVHMAVAVAGHSASCTCANASAQSTSTMRTRNMQKKKHTQTQTQTPNHEYTQTQTPKHTQMQKQAARRVNFSCGCCMPQPASGTVGACWGCLLLLLMWPRASSSKTTDHGQQRTTHNAQQRTQHCHWGVV